MYTYYTKTDDGDTQVITVRRLRLGSTRLILYLLPGHVLHIVIIYFKVDRMFTRFNVIR
jgi:hypothetical protein